MAHPKSIVGIGNQSYLVDYIWSDDENLMEKIANGEVEAQLVVSPVKYEYRTAAILPELQAIEIISQVLLQLGEEEKMRVLAFLLDREVGEEVK